MRALLVVALAGLLLIQIPAAQAAGQGPGAYDRPADQLTGRGLGMVPAHGHASQAAGTQNSWGPLFYHSGGSVQTGTHHTYAIFWGSSFNASNTSLYDPTYQSLVARYFGDVAHDSGATSNVYYSDTQYYQTVNSVKTYITYSEQYSGSWTDATDPSSNGCTVYSGVSSCVTDAQIQAEVQKAIANNAGWQQSKGGMGNEYFVFLGRNVGTCLSSSSCAFTQFCAYHSHFVSGTTTYLYSNMPNPWTNLSACGSGNYPNGDAGADSVLNVTSHEANETITDAMGNAWYDFFGYENGDKCAWLWPGNQGSTPGAQWDQTINGNHYELQPEYSNYSSNCVLTGK